MTFDYPSLVEVVEMHDELIRLFGGSLGLRDEGALASGLMRPQIGYYDGILQEAAATMESLAINHPFIDGNKRVAFATTDTFLRMNGYFVDSDNEEAYRLFMHLFEINSFRFAQLLEWLETVASPRDNRST